MAKKSIKFLMIPLVFVFFIFMITIFYFPNGVSQSPDEEDDISGWAKLNQEKEEYFSSPSWNPEGNDLTYVVQLPSELIYKSAKIVKADILFKCGVLGCTLAVNDVNCTDFPGEKNRFILYRLENSCIQNLIDGTNKIEFILPPYGNATIGKFWAEMKVLPAT